MPKTSAKTRQYWGFALKASAIIPLAAPTPAAKLGGLLGAALAANVTGRLSHFIQDESSPAIALFSPACVQHNHEGDWYGEHAGKWLYAAAKAARRTGDANIVARVRRVADYLVSVQVPDGYLGTYAAGHRFMNKQPPGKRTWDGAPGKRTWDIWTHSYLILGLLEVNKYFPAAPYIDCARRIGDLCWDTLSEGDINITELGNHHGMSATVLLDPAVELYVVTGEKKYLDLALLIEKQADEHPALNFLSRALAGTDAAEIGTGKAYQLIWNLVGLAKLHRATGDMKYLSAVQQGWTSIQQQHLTLGGGPWGGIGHRSREVFNHAGVFSPYGYVETCSTLSWIQLNRELLAITGGAKYADEIERSAYNDLLGAQAPNGDDWCYYSFPNGKRVHTTYWRCCKSSGAMAIEELPALAYSVTTANDIAVNLYGPNEAALVTAAAGIVRLTQTTDYPFDGAIRILVKPQRAAQFSIRVRVPAWAAHATIQVNGVDWPGAAVMGTYVALTRVWQENDEITLQFPMPQLLQQKSSRNVQESKAPDGTPISQEVMRVDYVAITRGPLVYATSLIDGFKMEETIRLPADRAELRLEVIDTPQGYAGPAVRLNLGYRAPLIFLPYYEAGGRQHGAWRLTWMQVAAAEQAGLPSAPGFARV